MLVILKHFTHAIQSKIINNEDSVKILIAIKTFFTLKFPKNNYLTTQVCCAPAGRVFTGCFRRRRPRTLPRTLISTPSIPPRGTRTSTLRPSGLTRSEQRLPATASGLFAFPPTVNLPLRNPPGASPLRARGPELLHPGARRHHTAARQPQQTR